MDKTKQVSTLLYIMHRIL